MQTDRSSHHRFELILLGVVLTAFLANSANFDLLLRIDSVPTGQVKFASSLDSSELSPIDDEDSQRLTATAIPTPSVSVVSEIVLLHVVYVVSATNALHLLHHTLLI